MAADRHDDSRPLAPGESCSFLCPFCGEKCEAGNHVLSGLPTPVYGVIHGAPMCETFDTLEPDEFLVACNRKRAGVSGTGRA